MIGDADILNKEATTLAIHPSHHFKFRPIVRWLLSISEIEDAIMGYATLLYPFYHLEIRTFRTLFSLMRDVLSDERSCQLSPKGEREPRPACPGEFFFARITGALKPKESDGYDADVETAVDDKERKRGLKVLLQGKYVLGGKDNARRALLADVEGKFDAEFRYWRRDGRAQVAFEERKKRKREVRSGGRRAGMRKKGSRARWLEKSFG